jgi:hypothetical protein
VHDHESNGRQDEMRRVHEVIEAVEQPLNLGSAMIVGFTWRGTAYRIVGRQGVFRPSPLTEYAHQQVMTDDGHVFQLHAERGDGWVLDAIPDDLALPDDTGDAASHAG